MKLLFLLLLKSKIMVTLLTMLISIGAYALVFGWAYALGFVALLLIHELGHFMAARQVGLDVGAPTFIPFVGAWIELKQRPHDVKTEAYIGIAGPVLGTVGAMGCYMLYRQSDDRLFLALAYVGCVLNLFNLIPVAPLDGERITAILSPRIWFLGVPLLALVFFLQPSPMLILIALLAFPQLKAAWRFNPQDPANQSYYAVSSEDRLTYTLAYLGLAIFLALMTYRLHLALHPIA